MYSCLVHVAFRVVRWERPFILPSTGYEVQVGCLNKYISKQTFIFPFNRQREFKLQFVYIYTDTKKVETSWKPRLEMAMWTKHMFRWLLQEPAQTIKEQVNVIKAFHTKWVWYPKNVFMKITSSSQHFFWKSNEPEWRNRLKVAQNSFQHIQKLRFWCVIITTLYQLMLQSWCQTIATL